MKLRLNLQLLLLVCLPVFAQSQSDTARMRESLAGAVTFLQNAQQPSGAIADSANPLFNTWETILVTDALLGPLPATDSTVTKALRWLHTNENGRGLICHNSRCTQDYCIETSALYLLLLHRAGPPELLTERIAYLENLQEPNGSWLIGNPDVQFRKDYVSVTAFLLNLFRETGTFSGKSDAALAYIASCQLEDGAFGQVWEYYNCPGYALWQCLPLLRNNPAYRDVYVKAKSYVLAAQNADGSWYVAEDPRRSHVSVQLQTALMLSALHDENDAFSRAAFAKGVAFLLQTQLANGAWDGGFFPIPNDRYKKCEYLFATALVTKLLFTDLQHKRPAND